MLARRTQEERREATLEALLAAGRKLFGARGYAGVSSAALAAAAGLTTGAMYHHFEDKTALFRAVFESVEAELAAAVRKAAAGPGDPLLRVEKGALAFLEAAREPLVRRIVLIDGPGVLGWERWRHIDEKHHLRPLKAALIVAMRAGLVERRDPDALARLLMGALTEAALDGGREIADSVLWLISRLRRT
jgi:AcrR family transcriptional regulator